MLELVLNMPLRYIQCHGWIGYSIWNFGSSHPNVTLKVFVESNHPEVFCKTIPMKISLEIFFVKLQSVVLGREVFREFYRNDRRKLFLRKLFFLPGKAPDELFQFGLYINQTLLWMLSKGILNIFTAIIFLYSSERLLLRYWKKDFMIKSFLLYFSLELKIN